MLTKPAIEEFKKAGQDHFDALIHQPLGGIIVRKGVVFDINFPHNPDFRKVFIDGFDIVKVLHGMFKRIE